MGLVNKVVPGERLDEETAVWCRKLSAKSPTALRFMKFGFNADTDHGYGLQALAHGAHQFILRHGGGERRPPGLPGKAPARFLTVSPHALVGPVQMRRSGRGRKDHRHVPKHHDLVSCYPAIYAECRSRACDGGEHAGHPSMGMFDWLLLSLVLLGHVLVQCGTNLTDEYADHRPGQRR